MDFGFEPLRSARGDGHGVATQRTREAAAVIVFVVVAVILVVVVVVVVVLLVVVVGEELPEAGLEAEDVAVAAGDDAGVGGVLLAHGARLHGGLLAQSRALRGLQGPYA